MAEGGVGLRVVSPAVPVGVATRFAIASVSKQFTAACVFLLRDQGKLSLDCRSPTSSPITGTPAK